MSAAGDTLAGICRTVFTLIITASTLAHSQSLSPAEALHQAVRTNHLDEARQLLAAGADVDARDPLGGTPLLDAAWNGNLDMVRLLLNHHADVNATHAEAGSTALEYAVLNGHADIAHLLLCSKADVQRRYRGNQTITHIAAARGQAAILTELLAAGAPFTATDANGNTPLDEAVLHDRLAVLQLLLTHGVSVRGPPAGTLDGRGPLHEAAVKGFADLCPVLLNAGADPALPDASGQSPLDLALAYKNIGVVKVLLANGNAHSRALQDSAARAMESATLRGQTDIVQLLISSGFDVNRPTAAGTTYLHDAALKGKTHVAELLLKSGANLDARNSTGGTPLHDAALGGSIDVISLLLDHGAPVNSVDTESRATPLMLAASLGRRDAVALLLQRGADPNLRDRAGLTALDRARKAEEEDTVKLLQSAHHL